MVLQFQYFAVDPFNLSATYFGDDLQRPFQYKIRLISNKTQSFEETLDYVMTEMNTGIECKVSQGQLIAAIAKGNTNDDVGDVLFGHPEKLLQNQDLEKYEKFILANPNFFSSLMREFEVGPDKLFLLLAIEIRVQFSELLRNIYKDMVLQNYDESQKGNRY